LAIDLCGSRCFSGVAGKDLFVVEIYAFELKKAGLDR
jgi:hypothetical protein